MVLRKNHLRKRPFNSLLWWALIKSNTSKEQVNFPWILKVSFLKAVKVSAPSSLAQKGGQTDPLWFFSKQTASAACLQVASRVWGRLSPWMLCLAGSCEPDQGEAEGTAGRGLCVTTHLASDSPYNIQFKWPAGWEGSTVLLVLIPSTKVSHCTEAGNICNPVFK